MLMYIYNELFYLTVLFRYEIYRLNQGEIIKKKKTAQQSMWMKKVNYVYDGYVNYSIFINVYFIINLKRPNKLSQS